MITGIIPSSFYNDHDILTYIAEHNFQDICNGPNGNITFDMLHMPLYRHDL